MHIIVPAVIIVVALLIWFVTDRVVYKGDSSVIANNMKHYSTTHKTVMVVPHKTGAKVGAGILVASVTNAKAADIAVSTLSTRQITVRRRIFGKPRVTSV